MRQTSLAKNRVGICLAVLGLSVGTLTALLGSSNPIATAAAAQTVAALSGKVADGDGAPLHAAIVRAQDPTTGVTTVALTGPDGQYRFPQLKPGEYTVSTIKKGYGPSQAKTVKLTAPKTGISFVQEALATIPLSQMTSADIIAHLPDSPNRTPVVGSCVGCHSLGRVLQQGRNTDEWIAVMEWMKTIPGGYVSITDETVPPMLDYLSTYFGRDTTLPEEFSEKVRKAKVEIPFGHEVIITEYDIPTPIAMPHTAVPDGRGNVWFAEFGASKVGRLELSTGEITEYPTNTPDAHPHGITAGPDGTVWFTALPYGIGRIDPGADKVKLIKIPDQAGGQQAGAHTIIVARSGIVWFTEILGGSIGRYDPKTGDYRSFPIEEGGAPYGIVEREDNLFWFALLRSSKIGFFDSNSGEVEIYPVPTLDSEPQRLRFDAKGRLWFGEYVGKIGMFEPASEKFTEYDLPFRGSAYSIHVDPDGDVWVGSFERDSMIRFDPDTKQMLEYPLPGTGAIVRDIWPDDEGRMWFVQWGRNKVTSVEKLDRGW